MTSRDNSGPNLTLGTQGYYLTLEKGHKKEVKVTLIKSNAKGYYSSAIIYKMNKMHFQIKGIYG